MPSHDAQHTDRENAKGPMKSVARDNDLKRNGRGGLQDVARETQPDNLTTRVEPSPVVR
jgi:hypothetical protein